jgi:hypothetical protein
VTYFWLSFVDDTRPKGEQFLGGCAVEADSVEQAIRRAWALGINPGGEVAAVQVPKHLEKNLTRYGLDRLLTKAELNAMGDFSQYDIDKGKHG